MCPNIQSSANVFRLLDVPLGDDGNCQRCDERPQKRPGDLRDPSGLCGVAIKGRGRRRLRLPPVPRVHPPRWLCRPGLACRALREYAGSAKAKAPLHLNVVRAIDSDDIGSCDRDGFGCSKRRRDIGLTIRILCLDHTDNGSCGYLSKCLDGLLPSALGPQLPLGALLSSFW